MRRYKALIILRGGRVSLLDVDVLARRKGAIQVTDSIQHLLDTICPPPGRDGPAGVVLIPADAECGVGPAQVADLAARLMRRGAARKKRRAARIRRMDTHTMPANTGTTAASCPTLVRRATPTNSFAGGELAIHADRVELDGVVVLTDQGAGLMRQILLVLKAKQDGSIHDSLSVKKLAARTDPDADIAKAILQFRDTVTREMGKERGVHCGRMSVIESGRHGYRYAKGITVHLIEGEAPHETHEAPHAVREAPHDAPHEPALNDRQKWIVAEYLAGRRPGNKDIQKANNCSRATASRDIRKLRGLGLICKEERSTYGKGEWQP